MPFRFPKGSKLFDKLADRAIPLNAVDQLRNDLPCVVLDELYPHLDLVARKCSAHIDPLHVHVVKGRSLVVFEHARLHLVWRLDRVFLKPIPACLFSEAFWTSDVLPDAELRPLAIGFMRTYAHLIRHPSDFALARQHGLLPAAATSGDTGLVFSDFESFIEAFRHAGDDEVARRYHFGQLRLSWLDWAVRIFRPRIPQQYGGMLRQFYYEEQFHQTRQFLCEFGAQLVAVFAAVSLILSAMQVALAAQPASPWRGFAATSAGFSVGVIVFLVAAVASMGLISGAVLVVQIGFGFRSRRQPVKYAS